MVPDTSFIHIELILDPEIVRPPVLLGGIGFINRIWRSVHDQRDIVIAVRVGHALHVPLDVMPDIWRKRFARNVRGVPLTVQLIPHIPHCACVVALASNHVVVATYELECIELKGLSGRG